MEIIKSETHPPTPAEAEAEPLAAQQPAVCPQCGAVIESADARFCAECGFEISQAVALPQPETPAPAVAAAVSPTERSAETMEVPTAPVSAAESLPDLLAPETHALRYVAAGLTDTGVQRDYNQDDFVICMAEAGRAGRPLPQVFVVADGMGGTVGGEIASAIARVRIVDWATKQLQDAVGNVTTQLQSPGEMLAEQVQAISEEIYLRAQSEGTDMGSTLTGAVVVNNTAYVVNVGDSRTYRIRAGTITRISKDHSLVERLIDAGAMLSDERYVHPQRNIILRSLGDGKNLVVDVFECALEPNDSLLICSDGLWEMVRDSRLCDIVGAASNPLEACQKLVQEANANGGEDNITAIVVWAI